MGKRGWPTLSKGQLGLQKSRPMEPLTARDIVLEMLVTHVLNMDDQKLLVVQI